MASSVNAPVRPPLLVTAEPITLATFLEPPVYIIDKMIDAFEGTKRAHLIPPLVQASDALRDAILIDERGLPERPPPEFEPAVLASVPPDLPPYVEKALKSELTALFNTPEAGAAKALEQAAFNVAQWAASGYLTDRDGQRAVWKVARSQNQIAAIGRDPAKQIIEDAWRNGRRKPRTIPNESTSK